MPQDAPAPRPNPKGDSPEVQIAKLMVRALWSQEWMAAHPEATSQERNAAWKEARLAENAAKLKTIRRALQALQRSGVEMTLRAKPAAAEA